MTVDFVPAAHVREAMQRIEQARQRVLDRFGVAPQPANTRYWESLFEANAAEVLTALPAVKLDDNLRVRYRFFGQRGRDFLVRPFVARQDTDITAVRRVLDWHPPPDSVSAALAGSPTQDVGLLYSYFCFPPTAVGVFEYWLAMQELWGSGRWAHSHLIASAEELSQITAGVGWEVIHPVETYEPAVVVGDHGSRLAVLMHCPIGRFEITLQQIEVGGDQSLRYGDPIVVAVGPKGYLL